MFSGITTITSVSFNELVEGLGNNAFDGANKLTELELHDNISSIGDYCFYNCTELQSDIILPHKLDTLNIACFCNCSKITNVYMPDSIKQVANAIFSGCTSLLTVRLSENITKISPSMFHSCSKLKTIHIPESVTYIGDYAFSSCMGLQGELLLPDDIYYIGSQAFYYCNKLTGTLNLPNKLQTIRFSAFEYCKFSGDLIIPDSVTTIEAYAFRYGGNHDTLHIGSGVTSLASNAFHSCHFKNIEVDSRNTNYDSRENCNCLIETATNILFKGSANSFIPNTVSIIANDAFSYEDFTSIVIPDSVTNINDGAFTHVPLQEITCYATTAPTIARGTFSNVSYYGVLKIPSGSDYSTWLSTTSSYLGYYKWFVMENDSVPELTLDGYDVAVLIQPLSTTEATKIYSGNTTALTEVCVDGTALDTITTGHTFTDKEWHIIRYKFNTTVIPSNAFSDCVRFYEMRIGGNITGLGSSFCRYCDGLHNLYIGSGVTSIDEYALNRIDNLHKIIVDPLNSVYDSRENCNCLIETATNKIWKGCAKSFIPDSVTSIGREAFRYIAYFSESLILPPNLVEIGTWAFSNCSGLTGELVLPDSVTSIGSEAFSSCPITSLHIGSGLRKIENQVFRLCSLKELVIPDSVTIIGDRAFSECNALTKVTIGSGVTSIGYNAFYTCRGLTGELVIPDSVTSIGSDAFGFCDFTSLHIGSNLSNLNRGAFANLSSLETITVNPLNTVYDSRENCNCIIETATNKLITGCKNSFMPEGIITIGYKAFRNCYELVNINMPNSVTTIEESAFDGCTGLTEINISNSVITIEGKAFYDCNLTEITFPATLVSIGGYCFYSCGRLSDITSYAQIAPTIQNTTFSGVAQNGLLKYAVGGDYSSWMSTSSGYLGAQGWTAQMLYTPTECTSLSITALDVAGRDTTTQISYTAVTNGTNYDGTAASGVTLTGTTTSSEFPQNTSETTTCNRTITFEYLGVTASTTITQGVWIPVSYTVTLNDQWRLSSDIANPDATIYDGVYESFSNRNSHNSAAIMYIDIEYYNDFSLYIRSNAESNYDYVMVSQLDQTITSGTSYSNTTLVKAHTRGNQQSGTAVSNYTKVDFTGIDGGKHRITVLYRKDSSANSGTDSGYVLIPK